MEYRAGVLRAHVFVGPPPQCMSTCLRKDIPPADLERLRLELLVFLVFSIEWSLHTACVVSSPVFTYPAQSGKPANGSGAGPLPEGTRRGTPHCARPGCSSIRPWPKHNGLRNETILVLASSLSATFRGRAFRAEEQPKQVAAARAVRGFDVAARATT